MTVPKKISAENGGIAIGGNNSGNIINVSGGSTVNLNYEAEVARKLPSHLGAVIALLASEGDFASAAINIRPLPPEVVDKLLHNSLSARHPVISGWTRHSLALQRAYEGVEQQNADARYLVRQRAGAVYAEELLKAAQNQVIPEAKLSDFVRRNAVMFVEAVTTRLLDDYRASKANLVESEIARLAVSLVVADAIVECEVLEKPDNVIAS